MSASNRPTLAEQQRFWDWHWKHDQERKTINVWKDQRHEAIVAHLRTLSLGESAILDLGCGTGWYTQDLVQFGHATGVDLSEEAITKAKSQFPHVTFQAGNLYEMALPPEHFDVVVAQEVFDHVEDQPAFLDRAAHLLKPGGHLILSCTNKFVMDRLADGEFPEQPRDHISLPLSMRELKRLVSTRFLVLQTRSIIPLGSRGILRLVNSHKLNSLLGLMIPPRHLRALKERAGIGYQLILLAQKRSCTSGPS